MRKLPVGNTIYYWNAIHEKFASVPGLTGMSHNSTHIRAKTEVTHLQGPNSTRPQEYPLMNNRFRVLAIGGIYRPYINYRHEVEGHMHYGKRCYICLELLKLSYRPWKTTFDMILCQPCANEWLLSK